MAKKTDTHQPNAKQMPQLIRRYLRVIAPVMAIAALGIYLLVRASAAVPTIAIEAESGTIASPATTATVVGASANASVQFKPSDNTPPIGTDASKPVLVNRQLQLGATGTRLKMRGVAVWGIQDQVTVNANTGSDQYNNRQKIANTIKAWGGNHIRLRLVADDYNKQTYMSKAQYIQQVKDWRDAVKAAGLYLQPVWWDSLDGAYSKGAWGTKYNQAFPMMTDVVQALGADPMVYYEPFNEPTNDPSEAQWLAAMKDTAQHFRNDLNYTGILLMDTRGWSHQYNDADMTTLEQYDATLTGMGGKHQIIFAKHDYSNEGFANPDSGFDAGHWPANAGGGVVWDFTKHAAWETEFGNYNLGTQHAAWSGAAATFFADKVNDGTLVGATAFVYRWVDANAMVGNDNTTPNQWGGYVKNNFLARVK